MQLTDIKATSSKEPSIGAVSVPVWLAEAGTMLNTITAAMSSGQG
jgi:hypothetical protein